MAQPDVQERVKKFGFETAYAGSEAFRKVKFSFWIGYDF